jgi:hypothetical protein
VEAEPEPAVAVRFGVDLGGVLWPWVKDVSKEAALHLGCIPAAKTWMTNLVTRIGAKNVFIISMVGERAQQMWQEVLEESGFLRDTGILQQNVHWVRSRTGPQGKGPRAEFLGLTHFVDDRADVLVGIRDHFTHRGLTVPKLYLVPPHYIDPHLGHHHVTFTCAQRTRTDGRQYGFETSTAGLCGLELPTV